MSFYAVIPARGGSKRIPRKNIYPLNGKPLIHYTLDFCQKNMHHISKVFVSTDDEEIANISSQHSIHPEIIKRPSEISGDLSTDKEMFDHFFSYLNENNIPQPIGVIHLRPTYPHRDYQLLNNTLEKFTPEFTSLRTVFKAPRPVQKMYYIRNNVLEPVFKDVSEPYNKPTQLLEESYCHIGCLDIFWTSTYLHENSITGSKIYPYLLSPNDNLSLNEPEDLEKLKSLKI